ncbi:MAG: 3-keto-5-aminohexanoate cleavage protein, partial [Chloroflexota bacterium]
MPSTILTCAIIGGFTTRDNHPEAPYTPEEIATACIEAAHAGATMVHIHVRDPETGAGSMDLGLYREVVDRIRESDAEVLINLTTGPGARYLPSSENLNIGDLSCNMATAVKRTEHVAALKPDVCSLDFGTLWFGTSAMVNVPAVIKDMAAIIYGAGCCVTVWRQPSECADASAKTQQPAPGHNGRHNLAHLPAADDLASWPL